MDLTLGIVDSSSSLSSESMAEFDSDVPATLDLPTGLLKEYRLCGILEATEWLDLMDTTDLVDLMDPWVLWDL